MQWRVTDYVSNYNQVIKLDYDNITFAFFEITLRSDDTLEAMRYIIYVIAQMVHLFIFCWEGQRLIDHSLQMRDEM